MLNKLNYAQPLPDARFSLLAIVALIMSIALPLLIAAIGVNPIVRLFHPVPADYIKFAVIIVPSCISGFLSILAMFNIRYSAGLLRGSGMAKSALIVSLLWLILQGSIVLVVKYIIRSHGY
jgi:hypothetical protein